MKPGNLAQLTVSIVLCALIFSPTAASATKSSPTPAQPQTTFAVNANTDVVDFLPGDGVCETASGNGMCTLRAAIQEANAHVGEDIIDLPAANFLLTIPGAGEDQSATGDLDITDSVRIRGTFYANTVIDAQSLGDRVFDLSGSGVAVYISRVTVQNGSVTGEGGAIRARAELTLQDFYLENNQASLLGGAIYSSNQLTLINGTIHGSSATNGGGAIYTISHLTASGTHFSHNSTDEEGGAIYATQNAHVHTVGVYFSTHEALKDGGTIYNLGELEMEGGHIFEGDTARSGGGIYAGANSQNTLTDVSITFNHASMDGGGIYTAATSVLNGQNLLLDDNSTDASGGGIYFFSSEAHLSNCVISGNTSSDQGAGIANTLSTIIIEDSTIISNTATTNGGGIQNSGYVTLNGVTLSANRAQNGGGVFNTIEIWIENSTISKNHSIEDGGGIYDRGFNTYINNSTITANLAGSTMNLPSGVGGGAYTLNVTIFIRNTILSGNHHRRLLNLFGDDCYGTLTSGDYNLVGTLSNCSLWAATEHNLVGVDPLLGDLADNGGATQTYALLEGSPAVDAANPAGCLGKDDVLLTSDQRGVARPLDGDGDGVARCDIGAFEVSRYAFVYLPLTIKISP